MTFASRSDQVSVEVSLERRLGDHVPTVLLVPYDIATSGRAEVDFGVAVEVGRRDCLS